MRPPPTRLRRFGEYLSLAGLVSTFAAIEFYMWPGLPNAWAVILWMPGALFAAMFGALPGWIFVIAADLLLARRLGVRWWDLQREYKQPKTRIFPK